LGLRFAQQAQLVASLSARFQASLCRRNQNAHKSQPFNGKVVHSTLECFYRHRQLGLSLTPADLCQRLIEPWGEAAAEEAVPFDSTDDEETSRKQAIDLVMVYLAQIPVDEPKPLAVEAAVEASLVDPVSGEDLGIPLVGIMDLVLPDNDGPEIVDFKTTARGGEPLEIMHEIQLSSYGYLFRHASHQEESALEIRQLMKTKIPKAETHRSQAAGRAQQRKSFHVSRNIRS
jgi:hypothetical protein